MSASPKNNLQNLSHIQLAYLAGFIDADGSIFAQIKKRDDYILKFQVSLSIVFFQKKTRKHHLIQIQNEIGKGVLKERNDGILELTLTGTNLVGSFLSLLKPFLRLKKKQANLMLKIIEQLPSIKNNSEKFIRLCELVDQIALLNDSKNRLITSERVKESLSLAPGPMFVRAQARDI